MLTTTCHELHPTLTPGGQTASQEPNELVPRYQSFIQEPRMTWSSEQRLIKLLGSGGQGVVFLTELRGTEEFKLPGALKMFSPERFESAALYDTTMQRMGRVASRIAQIQHDNLLYVYNFVAHERIRMMIMEWIDGYDLARLMVPSMLERIRDRFSARRWEYINRVVATHGPIQPRMKAGIAVAIVRDCLSGLAALHRHGIIHGDIKPSNIMLKRTGITKIVDFGSAFELAHPPASLSCTLAYAAPEVLERKECSSRSDLCSLGYVLIELLSGRPPFNGIKDAKELLEAKRLLPHKLNEILPQEVLGCDLLMSFCRGMIAFDSVRRFPSAEAAELLKEGAAAFHRQLVFGDLSAEYDNEIRQWLEDLKELDAQDDTGAAA